MKVKHLIQALIQMTAERPQLREATVLLNDWAESGELAEVLPSGDVVWLNSSEDEMIQEYRKMVAWVAGQIDVEASLAAAMAGGNRSLATEAAEIRANRGPCPELWLGCKIAEEAGEVVSELLAHLGMRRRGRPARLAEELKDLVSAALILGEMCGVQVKIAYGNVGPGHGPSDGSPEGAEGRSPERSAVTEDTLHPTNRA